MQINPPLQQQNAMKSMFDTLFEGCQDAIIVANHSFDIVAANAKANQLFRNQLEFLVKASTHSCIKLYQADQQTPVQHDDLPLRRVVRGETINDLIFFLPFSDPGQGTWLSISGSPIQQNFLVDGGGLIIVRDISKRKQQEAHNSRLALHDELTGLLSRGLFLDKVADAFSKAKLGTPSSIALLFIDIDRFKTINDSFGHGVGDQLLIEISRRIKRTLRASDSIARLGGDEFAVLLENVKSRLEIVEIVDRLVANVSDSYILGSHEVYIDLSIGIAIGNASYEQPEELVRDADIAMYQAKGEAEVYYKFFEQKMQFDTDENLKIEVDLRNALARHEFVLHYQPIVEIKTRRIIGFEALVRWNHPTLGLLPPNKFIPVAETTGLIVPLGWWVLREACWQMRQWGRTIPNTSSLFVSVNMSGKQFSQKYVVEKIQEILDETELSGRNLKLELTESILIVHSDSIISKLEAIRRLGIRLSIDDFGTGYSSLSYLHRFPFDSLKIDRSFIEDADSDFEKLEILQSVVRLAWNLGLEVIAEGIETQKNYAQLKALNCELGQGYLFSRPVNAQAIESLLRQ
jgi:diguanylate cyclase (GGDEF)-like protein